MTPEASAVFGAAWQEKAAVIDANLAAVSDTLRESVADRDMFTFEAMNSCLALLNQGKKVRGMLVLVGGELYGGADESVLVQAAGAIELCHAHLLVMDDTQDNTAVRRNGLAAHKRQGAFVAQHSTAQDAEKRGIDMVQTAGFGIHTHAIYTLLDLEVAPERSNLAVKLLNKRLFRTGIGQLGDLSPVASADMKVQDILQIATDKTAYYTFLLPLEIGAVLAGASLNELVRFHDYGLNTGIAFQLHDDIIGTFGDPSATGKPPMSDIMEGKKTFLMAKALEVASGTERSTLLSALGSKTLQADHFQQCKEIISQTGALEATSLLAAQYAEQAVDALHRDRHPKWPQRAVDFLSALALYSVHRRG